MVDAKLRSPAGVRKYVRICVLNLIIMCLIICEQKTANANTLYCILIIYHLMLMTIASAVH